MTTNASYVMRRFESRHCGWLLAGLMLFGGGSGTVASAQDVIAAGDRHSCALVYGRLQCWGNNNRGQLGNGTTTASTVPTPVATTLDSTVTAAAAGEYHTCAIVDGGLMCWGYNGDGQLGNDTPAGSTTPLPVSDLDSGVTAVAAGSYRTCAVVGGGLKCWGNNANGQLGTGDTYSSATPMDVFDPGSGVTAVAAGLYHTCAVVSSEVLCWGNNVNGELGTGDQQESLTPILVSGPISNAVGIAAGYAHSCAVLDTGGSNCWGYNGSGQLGDGSFNLSLVPVTVYRDSFSFPPLLGATAITAGGYHTCAATSSGAYCWGYNMSGQLGVSSTADSGFARPVSGLGAEVTAVAAGGRHTCAVASDEVLCWGSDEFSQLGDAGASPYVAAPDAPMPGAFNGVSAGGLHGCAVSAGGVYCWGSNRYGQLGTGTFTNSSMPQPVSGLNLGFVTAAAGGSHSCGMNSGGEVTCWGKQRLRAVG